MAAFVFEFDGLIRVAQIRAKLGPDAVVVNVRQLPADGFAKLWKSPRIEVLAYKTDSFVMPNRLVLEADSDYLRELKRNWDERLKEAFRSLPPPAWATMWDQNEHQQQA